MAEFTGFTDWVWCERELRMIQDLSPDRKLGFPFSKMSNTGGGLGLERMRSSED